MIVRESIVRDRSAVIRDYSTKIVKRKKGKDGVEEGPKGNAGAKILLGLLEA